MQAQRAGGGLDGAVVLQHVVTTAVAVQVDGLRCGVGVDGALVDERVVGVLALDGTSQRAVDEDVGPDGQGRRVALQVVAAALHDQRAIRVDTREDHLARAAEGLRALKVHAGCRVAGGEHQLGAVQGQPRS